MSESKDKSRTDTGMAVCVQHTEAGLGGYVSGTQVSGGEWARFQSADRSAVGGQSSPSPPELLQSLLVSASALSHQPAPATGVFFKIFYVILPLSTLPGVSPYS